MRLQEENNNTNESYDYYKAVEQHIEFEILNYSFYSNNIRIIESYLSKNKKQIPDFFYNQMYVAICEKNEKIINLIIKTKKINAYQYPYIVHACIINNLCNSIKLLLNDKYYEYNISTKFIFSNSIYNSSPEIVNLLIETSKINLNQQESFIEATSKIFSIKEKEKLSILWKNKEIKDKIKNKDIKLYKKFIRMFDLENKIKFF